MIVVVCFKILTLEEWLRRSKAKRVGLQRASLLKDNCPHASVEVENKI